MLPKTASAVISQQILGEFSVGPVVATCKWLALMVYGSQRDVVVIVRASGSDLSF